MKHVDAFVPLGQIGINEVPLPPVQVNVSIKDPMQGSPPNNGNVVIALNLWTTPSPQVVGHGNHADHSPSSQSEKFRIRLCQEWMIGSSAIIQYTSYCYWCMRWAIHYALLNLFSLFKLEYQANGILPIGHSGRVMTLRSMGSGRRGQRTPPSVGSCWMDLVLVWGKQTPHVTLQPGDQSVQGVNLQSASNSKRNGFHSWLQDL